MSVCERLSLLQPVPVLFAEMRNVYHGQRVGRSISMSAPGGRFSIRLRVFKTGRGHFSPLRS